MKISLRSMFWIVLFFGIICSMYRYAVSYSDNFVPVAKGKCVFFYCLCIGHLDFRDDDYGTLAGIWYQCSDSRYGNPITGKIAILVVEINPQGETWNNGYKEPEHDGND